MSGPTYTYSGDPDTDTKDAVRSLLGDTKGTDDDGTGWFLSDEEILWHVDQAGTANVMLIAADCAETIGSRVSASAASAVRGTKKVGDLQIGVAGIDVKYSADHWNERARTLRSRVSRGAKPQAGGIDRDDKMQRERDTTLTTPSFKRGQFDNPQVGYQPGGAVVTDEDWRTV